MLLQDYLNCCKFAEGDSRILMQKIARDRFSAFKRSMQREEAPPAGCEESALCMTIGQAVLDKGFDGWNESFEEVYALARAVIARTIAPAAAQPRL